MGTSSTPTVTVAVCGLNCMASTPLIDNIKTVVLLLIVPMILFRGDIVDWRSNRRPCKKEVVAKQLKNAPRRKGGEEN